MRDVRLPEPEQLVDAYPHQLSGGQRQRIMIAMALVLEPALLIADEPTTALDVTTQAQILRLIKDLQREHGDRRAVHHPRFRRGRRDRRSGRGDADGPGGRGRARPSRCSRAPEHPYTRMLISAVPSLTPRHRERAGRRRRAVLRTVELTKIYRAAAGSAAARGARRRSRSSIEVRRGETLGIVGESGSGKSTVARCIARLIDPTAGRDLTRGRDDRASLRPRRLRAHRRRVQIVFQDPYRSLNPRRTVGAVDRRGADELRPVARADACAAGARADGAGQPRSRRRSDRYPHQFSGGQRQRICIARALAMEPELLIADEAVSALDVSVQAQVLDLLDEIRRRLDLAMLFITHDLRVAAQVCDHVAVMPEGEVVEQGRAGEVFGNPRHAYTRALFAAAPGKDWRLRPLRGVRPLRHDLHLRATPTSAIGIGVKPAPSRETVE